MSETLLPEAPASETTEQLDAAIEPISLLDSRILRGCNVYHTSTVIRQSVDLGALAGVHTAAADAGFPERFINRFLTLDAMVATGTSGDFRRRLEQPAGVPFEEVLFRAILAVESHVAFNMRRLAPLAYGEMYSSERPGIVDMVWSCAVPRLSRQAAAAACTGLVEILPEGLRRAVAQETPADFERQLQRLRRIANRRQRTLEAEVLAQAASRRGLPCDFLGNAYLRLGEGYAQHIIHASFRGYANAAAGESAPHAASRAEPEQDAEAGTAPAPAGRRHCLLIVAGRYIAAVRVQPPAVLTDGQHSVRELIDQLNKDPKRNGVWLNQVAVTEELLASLEADGYQIDDVPEAGILIEFDCMADYADGAACTDVSDRVHADNRRAAALAAIRAGLTVATVELITSDITQPLSETAGQIVAVEHRAELAMYSWPRFGMPRRVGEAILGLAFPDERSGRIPILLVVGERGRGRVAKRLDRLLGRAGLAVGLGSRRGAKFAGQPIWLESARPHDAARFLLQHPRVECVIGETPPRSIVRRGLRLSRCDAVAIVDREPQRDEAEYRQAISVLLSATTSFVAIDVDNELAFELSAGILAPRVLLVSRDAEHPRVIEHLAEGRCAMVTTDSDDGEQVELRRGAETVISIPLKALIALAKAADPEVVVRDAMFALALACAAGLAPDQLRAAATRRSGAALAHTNQES